MLMSTSNKSIRRGRQFSLRALFVLVTVVACWLGYEVDWIRRRHQFLRHRDTVSQAYSVATYHRDTSLPRVDILSQVSETAGLLWLFGEEDITAMDVYVVVDDDDVDLTCPIEDYAEVERARRLFPEMQITAAIIPRSLLEQDWGEPLYMEEDDIVAEHIGMLECAFSELGDQRGIDYLKAMTVYAKGKRGNNISETRHGKFFGYRSKTILPADFFERNLDSQLVVLLQESYVAETEDSTEGLAHKYGADSLRKIKGTMCYAAYNRARETE